MESSSAHSEPHIMAYGPYVKLKPGHYKATFVLELGKGSGSGRTRCDIATTGGNKLYAEKDVDFASWPAGEVREIELSFDVEPESEGEEFEFRVWKEGAYPLILRDLRVSREQ